MSGVRTVSVDYVLALLEDITERKRTEEALRKSEALMESLFAANPAGVALLVNRVFVRVNPAMCRITGYSSPEMLGHTTRMLYLSEDEFERAGVALYEAMRKDGRGTLEFRLRRKDGRMIDVLLCVTLCDPADSSAGVVATVLDITERKQAERAVRESEQQFRIAFDNAPTGMSLLGPDGFTYLAVNPLLCEMFGYTKEEFLGNSISLVTHPDDVERSKEWVRKKHNDEPCEPSFEKRYIHKDGHIVWGLVRAQWIKNEDGSHRMAIAHILDITERKLAEAEIRRLNQELEQRVAERTAQLEAANKELEAFSYSVSHDLRAPLRHVTGYVNLLNAHAGATLDAEGHRLLSTLADAAQRMGTLIDDLLAFSRVGRAPMRLAPISVNQLVEECRQEFAPDLKGRSIEWVIPSLPEVVGDRALLKQVLLNLLGNAVKYTRKRADARIEMGCQPGDAEWQFFVRDNGIGFNMKYVNKLFGVFQRLHSNAEFEGTGIGLANVRRVIQRHGGRAWAEGELSRGAIFFFTLPMQTPLPQQREAEVKANSTQGTRGDERFI